MSGRRVRVLFAGGGTGGHLFPGIAVAREILAREPDADIAFVGTARGIETRAVPKEGFQLDVIRSAGLKGKSIAALARGVSLLPASAWDAWRVLSARRPDVVIGVGGYSSGPVVALAAARGIPTMVLEQNAVPGMTNRLLARVVRAAAVTYDATLPYFGARGFVSGNPVRPEFVARAADSAPAGARRGDHGAEARVLIFGGSQGAHAINVAMVEAAAELAAHARRLSITHQTGERDLEFVRDGYRRAGVTARVEPFIFEMEREMTDADLVVCRAGATTLAELTAAGRPAILIPLPTATDDHQRKNARVLAEAGAAEVIDERGLTGAILARRLLALVDDEPRRARIAAAARQFAKPEAARKIAQKALALAGGGR
ncbi:MAG: undecaprenyldiphospho-muramoylpentapeptide beta-N-acetylglucosaminyltransferase [Acidobacteria bacterium]|nr:undecaprenyldiphospho-muramoylpentapeptide beta-N-acetylglucosaminyltransferase [Acidobacteriota bacterium]